MLLSALVTTLFFQLVSPTNMYFFSEPFPYNSFVSATMQMQGPVRIQNNSLGIQTTADSILATDVDSGKVLYKKDSANQQPIASLTKLMTALVFLENNPGFEEAVAITQEDAREGGIVYLFSGNQVIVDDLFHLLLVSSTNEAAAAIARISTVPDFVAAMNQKAKELGMNSTTFVEPTGLEAGNISTAEDITILLKTAMQNEKIRAVADMPLYRFVEQTSGREITAYSTNQLLSSFVNNKGYKIIGAKTGYLEEAGYCIAVMIEKDGAGQVIFVLFGMDTIDDRWLETKGLIDWVFGNFKWPAT